MYTHTQSQIPKSHVQPTRSHKKSTTIPWIPDSRVALQECVDSMLSGPIREETGKTINPTVILSLSYAHHIKGD